MSSKSYIHVYKRGNSIIHTYIEDGQRKCEEVKYQPTLGYQCKEPTEWKNIYGDYLKPKLFDSMSEANEWKEANKRIFDVYGDIRPEVAFISDNYIGKIPSQKSSMNIYALDIECLGMSGFPKPENPDDFISCITFLNMVTHRYYVFGLVDFVNTRKDVSYYKCDSEKHLLLSIIDFFRRQDIDIITGWNTQSFDIPYIVKRLELIVGAGSAKELSPTKFIRSSTKIVNKIECEVFDIQGVIALDYMNLYQKFTFENKESYKLDFIAKEEKVGGKLQFKDEYDDFVTFYNENPQKYIEYNIIDVEVIKNLDDKLRFIDLAINFAYRMKCGIGDIFGTVGPWDALLYSELRNKGIMVPPRKSNKKEEYEGGFVVEPKSGRHRWVSVWDIVSSYPNTICSYNISPDTIIDRNSIPADLYNLIVDIEDIEGFIAIDDAKWEKITPLLKKYEMSMCANGTLYTTKHKGFLTDIVGQVFAERKAVKKEAKVLKNQIKELIAKGATEDEIKAIEAEIEVLESKSMVLKICVNSVYGALANTYFRFFDIRLASAITASAQVSNRGGSRYIMQKLPDISLVYGDTDSVFLSFEQLIKRRFPNGEPEPKQVVEFVLKFQDKILEPVIRNFFSDLGDTYNMFQRTIEMEAECIADVSIIVEKKKYAMHQLWKEGAWFIEHPKLKIKGIEVVRSSTPAVVRAKLKEALEIMFDSDNDALIAMVEKFKPEFFEMTFEEIAFPRGVNFFKSSDMPDGSKKVEEYKLETKGLPIQVRSAFIYNKALVDNKLDNKYQPIGSGDKLKYCYIKNPNKFHSNVLGIPVKVPEEFRPHFIIDYKTQWEKAFEAPLKKILGCIGWTMEHQATLDAFFDD